MSVPYRERSLPADLVAFLHFENDPEPPLLRGALLVLDPHGRAVEFCFNRTSMVAADRHTAMVGLARNLFDACEATPGVVVASVETVPSDFLTHRIEVLVPACRITEGRVQFDTTETADPLESGTVLFWPEGLVGQRTAARSALQMLDARSLLLEPFIRASRGLTEAFRETA